MKLTVLITSFTFLLGLFLVGTTFASSNTNVIISHNDEGATSDVKVESSTGNNTICVNGKCTISTAGQGKSTVCINGNCQTSENGNLSVQSEDGKAKVDVKSNGGTEEASLDTKEKQATPTAEAIKKEVEKKVEEQKNGLMAIIQEILKKFFTFPFIF